MSGLGSFSFALHSVAASANEHDDIPLEQYVTRGLSNSIPTELNSETIRYKEVLAVSHEDK